MRLRCESSQSLLAVRSPWYESSRSLSAVRGARVRGLCPQSTVREFVVREFAVSKFARNRHACDITNVLSGGLKIGNSMSSATVCGYILCGKKLQSPRYCSQCKQKAYCSKACQVHGAAGALLRSVHCALRFALTALPHHAAAPDGSMEGRAQGRVREAGGCCLCTVRAHKGREQAHGDTL